MGIVSKVKEAGNLLAVVLVSIQILAALIASAWYAATAYAEVGEYKEEVIQMKENFRDFQLEFEDYASTMLRYVERMDSMAMNLKGIHEEAINTRQLLVQHLRDETLMRDK